MRLSIIIPIYNVEQYIEQCLVSILNKTYKDLEIILVNDGSKDNSMKIIKKYLSDKRIKVINKKNGGLSSARNVGLKIATGEYIAFVDSDDWIRIDKLVELYNIIQNEKLDLIIGNGEYYPSKEKIQKNIYIGIKTGIEIFEEMLRKKDYLETVWKCIYSKKFLQENNIKFIEGLLHEDIPFMFECLIKAKRIKYENINFYIYRRREGSITTTKNTKKLFHVLYGIERILEVYKENRINNKVINTYILNLYYSNLKRLKQKNNKLILNLLILKKFSIKSYIKFILIFILSTKYKSINIDNKILNRS